MRLANGQLVNVDPACACRSHGHGAAGTRLAKPGRRAHRSAARRSLRAVHGVRDGDHRSPAGGRSRRSERNARGDRRQRPFRSAGHGVRERAALHPLRVLHRPLSGLAPHRRAGVRLSLQRADRRRAQRRCSAGQARGRSFRSHRRSAGPARRSALRASRCPTCCSACAAMSYERSAARRMAPGMRAFGAVTERPRAFGAAARRPGSAEARAPPDPAGAPARATRRLAEGTRAAAAGGLELPASQWRSAQRGRRAQCGTRRAAVELEALLDAVRPPPRARRHVGAARAPGCRPGGHPRSCSSADPPSASALSSRAREGGSTVRCCPAGGALSRPSWICWTAQGWRTLVCADGLRTPALEAAACRSGRGGTLRPLRGRGGRRRDSARCCSPTMPATRAASHCYRRPSASWCRASSIVSRITEVLAVARRAAARTWPPAVTFVRGPSRSADIGSTTCFGAHGPGASLGLDRR